MMGDLKRTGWDVVVYEPFVEVVPQDDTKEHVVGDECWCGPKVSNDPDSLPVIAHNSADGRELNEPDHWQEPYLDLFN